MTKRSTKRALALSFVSLLLCVSMFVGTTFAWFTDSVSSTNNIITAGNLDVELEYYDGTDWVAVDENTNVFEENTLWEPGHTEVVYLKVSNVGTLALKYALNINIANETSGTNVAGESFKLSDYIMYGILEPTAETIYASRDEARAAVTDAKKLKTAFVDVNALEATEFAYVTMVVYMPETVGNEANYKTGTAAPVINLGINLFATQETSENDSFDNRYDGEAFVPVADVTDLGAQTVELATSGQFVSNIGASVDLDASFSFKTTEDDTAAAASGYRYWHADFVVSADKDVKANSLALAGYYSAYCDLVADGKWIALVADQDVAAGTEIRLLELMGVSGGYEELCNWIPEFLCGVADLTGENEGTTLTVELRLYETTIYSGATSGSANIETGEFITIGTYSYTFPTYRVNTIAELQAALDAAVDGDIIEIGSDLEGDVTATQKPDVKVTVNGNGKNFAGYIIVDGKSATYTTAGLTIKNLNFVADSITEDACINLGKDGDNNTRYTCNVTVDNCTFDVPGAVGVKSYTGGDKNLTIINCTATERAHSLAQLKGIEGVLVKDCTINSVRGINFNNSLNIVVENCTIDVEKYALRFGESANTTVENYEVKDCTIISANGDGDAAIVLRAGATNANLTITNTSIAAGVQMSGHENANITIQ